jgi:hypothetical protein
MKFSRSCCCLTKILLTAIPVTFLLLDIIFAVLIGTIPKLEPAAGGILAPLSVIFIISYVMYLIECGTCGTAVILRTLNKTKSIVELEQLYSVGRIQVKPTCFHIANKTGKTVSFHEIIPYPCTLVDVSEPQLSARVEKKKYMYVTTKKEFSFSDKYSSEEMEAIKERVTAQYSKKDDGFEILATLEIDGFKEEVLVDAYPFQKTYMFSTGWYILSSIFLCSLLYRLIASRYIQRVKHTIHKRITYVNETHV